MDNIEKDRIRSEFMEFWLGCSFQERYRVYDSICMPYRRNGWPAPYLSAFDPNAKPEPDSDGVNKESIKSSKEDTLEIVYNNKVYSSDRIREILLSRREELTDEEKKIYDGFIDAVEHIFGAPEFGKD